MEEETREVVLGHFFQLAIS